jgi:prepilin-type N-terminal cleavage/methylation domain-containing protein
MNRKVAAFTLIELTIAMLIASIAISITYTAYTIVIKLYTNYTVRQEKASAVTLLNKLLSVDFIAAEQVLRTEDGFQIICRNGKIRYTVTEDFVVRDQFSLRTDTFNMSVSNGGYYFEKTEVDFEKTIDEVHFSIALAGYVVPLRYYKQYSSQNLFK